MRILLTILSFLLCCASFAQQKGGRFPSESRDDSWEQYLSKLYSSDEEATMSMEEAYEVLTELAQQPLDINTVGAQELMQIPGLDVNQINDIITYRQKYGNFRSVDELAMIASIDRGQRLFLSNFLTVYDKDKVKWYSREGFKEALHHISNEITLTAQVPTYYRAGDIGAPTETYLGENRYAGKYLGDPVKHSVRYTLNVGNNITFNFTGAKTAGEPFFGSENRWGYDSYAYNLVVRQLGRRRQLDGAGGQAVLRQLVVGTFRGQFGMGLILNNNFYMGKQGMLSSVGRRASIFTPHSSASDSKHFQGVAATINISRNLELSSFFSFRKIDATLNADASTSLSSSGAAASATADASTSLSSGGGAAPTISTIVTTGYHRTATEMAKKNNASILTTGLHLGYERHWWGVGLNAIYSHLDHDINPVYSKADTISWSKLYRKYNATGNDFWNISLDYRFRYHDLSFAGETATGGAFSSLSSSQGGNSQSGGWSESGSIATVNSLAWRSPWGITFMAVQRFYAYQYTTLYGRSFGDNSTPQNESGIYFGLQWKPRNNLTIDAYTDVAYFPWLKYLVSNSSYCWDSSITPTLTTGNWTWSLRYRIKTKQRNASSASASSALKELENRTDQRLRFLAILTTSHWSSRTQIEGCLLNYDSSSKGFIVSEGLGYKFSFAGSSINHKSSSLSINGTAAYFNTDDYDSRLYTYEQGMKYSFGTTSYYGKGMRLALMARYQPWRWLIAAAKVSHTRYFDRQEIGTAERMIFSNHYTDLDFQLIFKL